MLCLNYFGTSFSYKYANILPGSNNSLLKNVASENPGLVVTQT